jgi:hypothetical protein
MAVTIDGSAGVTYPVVAGGTSAVQASSAKVLQAVSTTKTDTFTTTSTTDVAITGLSASITPTSSSNKVLVIINIGASGTTVADYAVYFSLYRNASLVNGAVGATAGSRKVCTSASRNSNTGRFQSSSIMFIDSPSTTSATTYACYASMESGGGNACINRNGDDTDAANRPRTISSITVMEIGA